MPVSAIQVKNVPDELHDELRRRAAEEGVPAGEIVLRALRRELRAYSMREWMDRVAAIPLARRPTSEEWRAALEEERQERRHDW